jgi:HAE1 family hydrophobic/amphiphilic exporter-1
MTRVPGVGQVQIFGAGQYAMRMWVNPDTLAKLGVTVTEILDAIKQQNTVNPRARWAASRCRPVRSSPTRCAPRAASVGGGVREVVVARESRRLDDQDRRRRAGRARRAALQQKGRLNGKPAAILAIYQLAGSNAIDT